MGDKFGVIYDPLGSHAIAPQGKTREREIKIKKQKNKTKNEQNENRGESRQEGERVSNLIIEF